MSDSPYGDDRLSRTRSLGGHPSLSQVLPQRAPGRKQLQREHLCACWIVPCPKAQAIQYTLIRSIRHLVLHWSLHGHTPIPGGSF